MDDKVKELLDRIRDTASAAADTAADTARVAGRKAGQMVDVAKLNVQLFDLNGEFSDILKKLGQVMYDTHRGQGGESADVAGLLERADEVSEKIREVNLRSAPEPDLPCLRRLLRQRGQILPGLRRPSVRRRRWTSHSNSMKRAPRPSAPGWAASRPKWL